MKQSRANRLALIAALMTKAKKVAQLTKSIQNNPRREEMEPRKSNVSTNLPKKEKQLV